MRESRLANRLPGLVPGPVKGAERSHSTPNLATANLAQRALTVLAALK